MLGVDITGNKLRWSLVLSVVDDLVGGRGGHMLTLVMGSELCGEAIAIDPFAWSKYVSQYTRTLANYGVLLPSLEPRAFWPILMLMK